VTKYGYSAKFTERMLFFEAFSQKPRHMQATLMPSEIQKTNFFNFKQFFLL